LFYTNPRRSPQETAELYSENYFVSDDPATLGYDDYSLHEKGLKKVFSEHLSVIEAYAPPPASIIDVGCAFGYFLQVAEERGWTAEGIELSPYASQVARDNTKAQVYTGTVADRQLGEARYDAVTMWDMLEHSHDPTQELTEVSRILKPGGYLFLSVPDAGSLIARIMGRQWYGFKSVTEHNYFFTKDTLFRLLENTGFDLVESRRGVWPCSMRFLASKLAPYSPRASRLAERLIKLLRMEKLTIRFRFIDMFVVARKCETAF
jgi:SAM-dependent methyltransferase